MHSVNFTRTYQINETYESIKERAHFFLEKYKHYSNLISFNDAERCVTFTSERLIPESSTNRPRVMLLFSNPHPHSIHQGMFLSPNTKGKENLFWPVMKDAGWLSMPEGNFNPAQRADICFKAKYEGTFEFIFYPYYAFPTDYPEHIRKIFGREYFNQIIDPEAKDEFRKIILNNSVDAVLTFNKGIFNLVAVDQVKTYIDRLKEGGQVRSWLKDFDREVPIFLTFPTGWRYHKQYRELRKASLETIKTAIIA